MGIFRRIGRLLAADMHGVLDVLEDPVDSCKQAIREMEEEIDRLRTVAKVKAGKEQSLREQRKNIENRVRELAEQADLCLSHDEEDLARSALRRKLEQEKILRTRNEQLERLIRERQQDEKLCAEYEDRLSMVRERLFSAQACSPSDSDNEREDSSSVSDDEVELALLAAKTAAQSRSTAKGAL